MAIRIAGINLPDNKRLPYALTEIYGIGQSAALKILEETGLDASLKPTDLSPGEENKLRDYIEDKLTVEGELRREIVARVKHLKDAKTYRGERHSRNLPARGQRTKTNSRTVRGNIRKTAGSGKRTDSKT